MNTSILLELPDIRKKIESKAQLINAPIDSLPTYDKPQGDGRPYIELYSLGYNFIISERLVELERRTTNDIDELMFWVFDGITHEMAIQQELRERKENEDFRRKLFSIQVHLMEKISLGFANKLKMKIDDILKVSPYNDNL